MPPRDTDTGTTMAESLSEYVRLYLSARGESHNKLANRSVDPEGGGGRTSKLLRQYIIDLVEDRVGPLPPPWKLRALAKGMADGDPAWDVDAYRRRLVEIKRLAAKQWIELDLELDRVDVGEGEQVIIEVPATLSQDERKQIAEMAAEMGRMIIKRTESS